jgi:lysine decarboxylase
MGRDAAKTPYLDALLAYAAREPARLNIPGHKGGSGADPALVELLGEAALRDDIPALIEGIDVGPPPTPFQRAQELAAEAWGARRSWFLHNGASQGNHAACFALRHRGESVVVQRNVHSSAVDGLILAGLRPSFVAPELDPELGLAHCVTAEALERVLAETPDAVGAICVSPTYFGAVADVRALAEVAHERGVPLVVDEAWGAHLRFSPELPEDALAGGADLVISSTHKIVGSLGQSAILHLGRGELLDQAVVDRCVTLVESTSPSSLLAGSLDGARRQAAEHGEGLLAETVAALREARERIRAIEGLDVLDDRLAERPGVAAYDPLRLAIDVRGLGITGYRLAELLRDREEIHFELASENVVVAVFGLGAPAAPLVERLVEALRREIDELAAEPPSERPRFAPPPPWGTLELTPRQAFLGPQEAVSFAGAEGRIAAESLAAYPPGIPNVLPGERLTGPTLDYITEALDHGGSVRGAADRTLDTVRAVVEDG